MSKNYSYSHIMTSDPNDLTLIDPQLMIFINGWRTYAFGIDVRESGARAWESIGIKLTQFNALINQLSKEFDYLQNQLNEVTAGMTQDAEVKQARVGTDGTVYVNLKARIDDVENKEIEFGDTVGITSLNDNMLVVTGLNSPGSNLSYSVISTVEDDEIPFGIETINAKDIGIEKVGSN